MKYESIAEQVHELVKNPKGILSLEHRAQRGELKTHEVTVIQRVFSEYEVSGDVLTIETLPLGFWG